jgi:glucosamine--fructose-6-phosphate aminotransferase (isomerizing)
MTAPTHFKRDIFRQTSELATTVKLLVEMDRPRLARAAELVRDSRYVFLTGIGASWNAAMGTAALFGQRGFPVYTVEAAELLYDTTVPPGSVVIAISRSGRSAEIVQLCAKLRQAGATLIGITNSPDSPLAKESSVAIVIPIQLDYAISVNTYSTLLVAAAALAGFDTPDFDSSCASFLAALPAVEKSLSAWEEMVSHSPWLDPERNFYFLARGPSIASCYQARLLWEEGAKSPATAMTSSGFRHGPQEIIVPGMRFCMWIDGMKMRAEDLAVAEDLKTLGAAVALIGQDLPTHAADLIFQIPPVPAAWQFAVDVIPMQLAAETLALLRGVDCDSFRICSYIVENEYGLLGKDHPRKLNGGRIGLKDS